MSKPAHQRALDVLVLRCGVWSLVHTRDGRARMILDIAWGFDLGDEVAHITTNISPGPDPDEEAPYPFDVELLAADEITRIQDPETGAVLLDLEDE